MTRYTFVLIVCRTVGVLAIFPLARFICQLEPALLLTSAVMGRGVVAFSVQGAFALGGGIGILLACGLCGLNAEKIARRLWGPDSEDGVGVRLSAMIAIFLIALLGLPTCRELALAGFIKMRMSSDQSWSDGSFGDLVIDRLGANFREIWRLVFELTALVVTGAVIVRHAVKAPAALRNLGR